MYRRILIYVTFLLIGNNLSAQNTKDFAITIPAEKVQHSFYNSITVLDSRPDTTNFGIVQIGFFNKDANVVPKKPLAAQLSNLINVVTDASANKGELLLQLRRFSFAEITHGTSEKGYCYFNAILYSKTADHYQELSSIDTLIVLHSSIDVTHAILKAGSDTLSAFVVSSLLSKPAGPAYSYNDLVKIDSIEKSKTKLYNTTAYVDGLYKTYHSFKDQLPDGQFVLDVEDLNMAQIQVKEPNGKLRKVKPKNIYALVYKGKPYVVSENTYYPLVKVNGDFTFTGKAAVSANTTGAVTAQVLFGMIGGLLVSNPNATFDIKIDHLNGGFIKLREIPEPQTSMDKYVEE